MRSERLGFTSAPATTQTTFKGLEGGGSTSALRAYEGLLLVTFKRISLLLLSVSTMIAFAVATAEAEQLPDDNYNPPIANPAYAANSGPVVAIDEAHYNFHAMTETATSPARYRPFATLLQRDGYVVQPFRSQFSAQSLEGIDILVISNPQAQSTADQAPNYALPTPSAYTDEEIEALRTWVQGGGSLWLIADHFPWPGSAENLAAAFGIRTLNGYAENENVSDHNFYFRRGSESEILTDNEITNGRTAAEKVSKQVSFTGSAFRIDEDRNAQPLLIIEPDVVSIMATRAWSWNGSTPRIPVARWYQGAVMRAGEGRVAMFGEAAMFSAQINDGSRMGMNDPKAEENYKFVLNVAHWLSGLLDPNTGTDSTPPKTTIYSGPSSSVSSVSGASATFTFSSNELSSTYECSLDGNAYGSCTTPKTYTNLSDGSHTFSVRATDASGNTDTAPASRTWTINTAAKTASLTSTADARLIENSPTTNSGTSDFLLANGDQPAGSGRDTYSVLRWNLSSIPADSKVIEASVTLNVTGSSTQTYQAYELKRPWVESAATWRLYASGSSWEVAGAKGTLDRGAQVGSISPAVLGKRTFTLSASAVQNWIANPSTNNGIIIANTTNNDAFDADSREATSSGNRPQLRVTYAPSTGSDTTAPETTIDSGPSGTVNSGSATFAFSSDDANSTFECSLDDAPFSSCSSSKNYTSLAEGTHTFRVRATDAAGNTDASPAERTWTVDTGAPTVDSTAPANGATDVAVTNSVSATFSEAMNATTISGSSLTLLKSGATTPVSAQVSYDSASRTATLKPGVNLEPGVTYTATVKGGANGVKDAAGNPLGQDKSWSFTTAASTPVTQALTYTSAADTTIVEDAPTTNYGLDTVIYVGGDDPAGSGKDRSALLRWNILNIPAGSKIVSATIHLNITDASVDTYQAYALKQKLLESAATWNVYAAGKPWEIPGAKGSLDREATVVATVTPSTTGKRTFELPPDLVQRWLDNPATNGGIIIANETNKDGFSFNSNDYLANNNLRPKLKVTYTSP